MKLIRKSKLSKFFSLLISLILIQGMYSCYGDSNNFGEFENDKQVTFYKSTFSINNLSGEDIYRGIFFLENDLATQVPILNQKVNFASQINFVNQEASEIKENIITDVINSIKDAKPNYFEELKRSLIQKDYYSLQENINLGANLLSYGFVNSNTIKEIDPHLQSFIEQLDMNSYNFENSSEIERFLSDLQEVIETMDPDRTLVWVAAIVAVVAVIAAVTVAISVSWAGLAQIVAAGVVFTKWVGLSNRNVLTDLELETLTYQLINNT